MYLLIQTEQNLYTLDLSKTISGRFYIHHQNKKIAYVRAYQNKWQLCAKQNILLNQNDRQVYVYDKATHVLCDQDGHRVFVYAKKEIAYAYQKYTCNQSFSIGRSKMCDIAYDNPFVSSTHACVRYHNNTFYMEDMHSSNHTYVNGKRFEKGTLAIGDVITIMGLQLVVGLNFWAICDENNTLMVLSSKFQPYVPCEATKSSKPFEKVACAYRPAPTYEPLQLDIKEKPNQEVVKEHPVWLKLGPSFMMGIMAIANIVLMLQRSNNTSIVTLMPSILMSCSMLLTACLFPLLSQRYQRKIREKEKLEMEANYQAYLLQIQQQIEDEKQKEQQYLQYVFPTIEELYHKNTYGYATRHDMHFLKLRVGLGNVNTSIELKGEHDFPLEVENTPIYIDITKQYIIGVTGQVELRNHIVETILVHACFVHAKEDLKIACIGKTIPHGLRWLPHIEYLHMRCFIDCAQSATAFQDALQNEIIENKHRPALLLCLFDHAFDHYLPILKDISSKPYQGISYITCTSCIDKDSHAILDLDQSIYQLREERFVHRMTFDISSYNTKAIRFLANQLDSHSSFQMPSTYPFLSMFEVHMIEELNIWKRWEQHQSYKSLSTPIGLHENGQLLHLDIHEKNHGPHGLLAGMTGSGKSECILTYLLSMAVNYHPDDVQFLIIDYKGGGLAKLFESLPHTVGILTNLDESLLQRAFLSIQSEVLKRQMILKETAIHFQMANLGLNEYQKLFYEHKVKHSLAHLIIVCDEFAELKMQQPMYMDQLISTARIGRSLGIHLMLATQKPSGIVNDQIWSNTHFHLCMKVADKADSMDMIHRPDSAYLKNSGQFYLQIGNNEAFMKGLCAWSQAPYEEEGPSYMDKHIKVVSMTNQILHEICPRDLKEVPRETQFEAIIHHLIQCANMKQLTKHQVWMPPLLHSKSLSTLHATYPNQKEYLLMGEIDDPTHQCYRGFYVPIKANILLYANQEQQHFLEVFIATLALTYPLNVQLICIDMLQEGFLKKLSFITTYLSDNDYQQLDTLFKSLHDLQKQKTIKQPIFYIIIHGISAFERIYGAYVEQLHHFLREGTRNHVHFLLTAKHEDEIAYRIRPFFAYSYVMDMDQKEAIASILNCSTKQIGSRHVGKGYFNNPELQEFQLACIP